MRQLMAGWLDINLLSTVIWTWSYCRPWPSNMWSCVLVLVIISSSLSQQQPCGGGSRLCPLCPQSLDMSKHWWTPVWWSPALSPLKLLTLSGGGRGWTFGLGSEVVDTSFHSAAQLLTARIEIKWVGISKAGRLSLGELQMETAQWRSKGSARTTPGSLRWLWREGMSYFGGSQGASVWMLWVSAIFSFFSLKISCCFGTLTTR